GTLDGRLFGGRQLPHGPAPSRAICGTPHRLVARDHRLAAEEFGETDEPPLDRITDQRLLAARDVELNRAVDAAQAGAFQNGRDATRQALAEPHRLPPAMRAFQLLFLAQLREARVGKLL